MEIYCFILVPVSPLIKFFFNRINSLGCSDPEKAITIMYIHRLSILFLTSLNTSEKKISNDLKLFSIIVQS